MLRPCLKRESVVIMFGSFLPKPWLVGTAKVYSACELTLLGKRCRIWRNPESVPAIRR
jgi:hypothetical protein